MSDEIIKVLNYLGEKFGVIIDWSNDNIIPYIYDLMDRVIRYEICSSIIYIIISILLGLITYTGIIDILPIICSILYTLTIIQDKEKNIRRISLVNIILWIIYDIVCQAYTAAISDSLMTISTIIGMYRFDYKKKESK